MNPNDRESLRVLINTFFDARDRNERLSDEAERLRKEAEQADVVEREAEVSLAKMFVEQLHDGTSDYTSAVLAGDWVFLAQVRPKGNGPHLVRVPFADSM